MGYVLGSEQHFFQFFHGNVIQCAIGNLEGKFNEREHIVQDGTWQGSPAWATWIVLSPRKPPCPPLPPPSSAVTAPAFPPGNVPAHSPVVEPEWRGHFIIDSSLATMTEIQG